MSMGWNQGVNIGLQQRLNQLSNQCRNLDGENNRLYNENQRLKTRNSELVNKYNQLVDNYNTILAERKRMKASLLRMASQERSLKMDDWESRYSFADRVFFRMRPDLNYKDSRLRLQEARDLNLEIIAWSEFFLGESRPEMCVNFLADLGTDGLRLSDTLEKADDYEIPELYHAAVKSIRALASLIVTTRDGLEERVNFGKDMVVSTVRSRVADMKRTVRWKKINGNETAFPVSESLTGKEGKPYYVKTWEEKFGVPYNPFDFSPSTLELAFKKTDKTHPFYDYERKYGIISGR